jgi:VCBS repeat-containing protein
VHHSPEGSDTSSHHFSDLHANGLFGHATTDGVVLPHGSASSVIIDDAHLLFSGHFSKSGVDLVLSHEGHEQVVRDYFKGETHATLFSPDGASLSGEVVDALVGHTEYAQAAGTAASANSIGHIAKLSGSASVVRNGVTVELNIGDNVFKGDVVQSGSDTALGISFIDGTAFSLASNARMVLNEMVYDPNGSSNSSVLSLVQGAITFVAGQTAKNGSMKIETPVATMGIRGTAVLCEIAANDGPTKFSVLVEPGNHVGSFVLYHKVTGVPLGTVSHAGMVTLVTPAGLNQLSISEQAKTLADLQSEKDIIQQVFSIAFPKLNDANPKSHFGSNGSGTTPFGDDSFDPFPVFGVQDPVKLASLSLQLPGFHNSADFSAPFIFSLPAPVRHDPVFIVTNASTFQFGGVGNVEDTQSSTPGNKDFTIADHVTIQDPDIGTAPFFDIGLPYVPGTGKIVSATGPSSLPAGFNLLALVSLDPATGTVTYDPSLFQFLDAGEKAVFVITFDSKAGPDTAHESLQFIVNGLDDAPVFTTSEIDVSWNETPNQTGSSDPISKTIVLPFHDPDFSDVGAGYKASILHVSAAGVTKGLPQDPAALDAALKSYLTFEGATKDVGSTDGSVTESFSAPDKAFDYLAAGETLTLTYTIQVTDSHGASSTETLKITINGTNDAPVVDTHDSVLNYVADHSHAGKVVDAAVTISDVDSQTLSGATVAITDHFHAGQDFLTFCDQNNIHGSFDASTGVLTLSGTASVADYQTALQSVEYYNASSHASDDVRTVSFSVNDGSASNSESSVATASIAVTPQDCDPVARPDNIIVSSKAFESFDHFHSDSHLAFTLFGASALLANDDGGRFLHVKDFPTQPSHGFVGEFFPDTLTYVLDPNSQLPSSDGDVLQDSFTYRAADVHGTSNPANVDLTIVKYDVNDPAHSTLSGTAGNDIIIGAAHAPDRIEGGAGNDILSGGVSALAKNADTFVFAPGSGHDVVLDFQHGIDKIELDYFALPTGPNWFDAWVASGAVAHVGADTILALNPADPTHHDAIVLKNVTNISANDFIIHPGGVA